MLLTKWLLFECYKDIWNADFWICMKIAVSINNQMLVGTSTILNNQKSPHLLGLNLLSNLSFAIIIIACLPIFKVVYLQCRLSHTKNIYWPVHSLTFNEQTWANLKSQSSLFVCLVGWQMIDISTERPCTFRDSNFHPSRLTLLLCGIFQRYFWVTVNPGSSPATYWAPDLLSEEIKFYRNLPIFRGENHGNGFFSQFSLTNLSISLQILITDILRIFLRCCMPL